MFSQFRQAVEGFAPPPPRRTDSQDVARSGSPGPGHLPKSNSLPDARVPKSNLEERLRAKLAAAESSRSSSSSPIPVSQHPLSPTSTPLPPSPPLLPAPTSTFNVDTPLNLASGVYPRVQSPQQFSVSPTTDSVTQKAIPLPTETAEENDDGADISDAFSLPVDKTVKEMVYAMPVSNGIDLTVQDELAKIDANDTDMESLQTRLKLVEQRFTGIYCVSAVQNVTCNCADTSVLDVSTSFKRLQAEKLAADTVLRELSPLQTMQDVDSLRDYLQNVALKTEVRFLVTIISNV